MVDVSFAPGELITDRFRIVRLLAEGGMGKVYEAEDLVLEETVALKIVGGGGFNDRAGRRFRREVQLARKVTHPNVCRLFDVFRHQDGDRDLTFVTMELLRGETLAELLARRGRLPPTEAHPLVRQMVLGLAAAHAAGVIHRDLKTRNVMLVPQEGDPDRPARVVITDFGVALPADPDGSASSGGVAGTAAYMAPEQVLGHEITTACDVYSLGVVMFELLTGELPHPAGTPLAVLGRRLERAPRHPAALVPDLDPVWNAVVARCLEIEPGDRFASVLEVLRALEVEEYRPFERLAGASKPGRRSPLPLVAALIAVATLAVAVTAWRGRGSSPPTPPSPVQISTWPGLEVDPVFSPDGSTIALSSDRSGAFEIFIQPLTPGSVARQLTDGGRQCFQPAWSPDGDTIAFYTASASGGIWTVSVSGGTPRRLTDFGSQPKFSPDGRWIAFQSDARAQLAANSNDALPPSTIWLLDLEGGPPRALTRAGQPAGGHGAPTWAPDGRRIFFSSSNRRSSEIWAVDVASGDLTEVVTEPSISLHPECSPDGRSLYFSAVTAGERYGVWRIPISKRTGRATGTPVIVLNLGSAIIRHLALSADGTQMVYSAISTSSNLWALPLDPESAQPTGPSRPLTSGTGRNNRPAISPDGASIAFDRWHVGVNRAIWMMTVDGSDLRQVTTDQHTNTHPSWLPDGRRLAFLSNHGGGWGMWTSDLETGTKERLVELPGDAGFATLSPDGRAVAYHTANQGAVLNVWVMDVAGGHTRQLTFDSELAGFPTWSPDGLQLTFEIKRGDDTHLAIMPSAGGEPTTLVTEPGDSWPFSYSPDGRRIAFSGKRDEYWNLYWVSVDGELHQLTQEHRLNTYLRYPRWSPRGDLLVYELAETTGDIWMLETLP